MQVHVNTQACSGQARCQATSPKVFRLNEEGYNDSDDYEVTDSELVDASRGALACPEQAITLVDAGGTAASESELRQHAGMAKG